MLLLQYHFDIDNALFNCNWLSNAHVLELGYEHMSLSLSLFNWPADGSAGTGLLSIALSPLVRQYTVTDIADLVPLIRKNLALNTPSPRSSNVTAEELDWVQFESTSPDLRSKFFSCPIVDLLLVVDCVYHPSLLPPLIETINHLTTRGKTIVLIAVELRSEEVIREFLDLLIRSDESWEIWSVGEHLLDMSYAIWTLWKGKIDSIVDWIFVRWIFIKARIRRRMNIQRIMYVTKTTYVGNRIKSTMYKNILVSNQDAHNSPWEGNSYGEMLVWGE